jgi:hypothetical protein
MRRPLFVGCPMPRELLLGYCAVCVAEWKWQLVSDGQVAEQLAAAQQATAGPDADKPAVIPVPRGFKAPPVELAVTMAPAVQFGGAMAPLCWTHAPALEPPKPAPEANGHGTAAPGLIAARDMPGLRTAQPRQRGRDA